MARRLPPGSAASITGASRRAFSRICENPAPRCKKKGRQAPQGFTANQSFTLKVVGLGKSGLTTERQTDQSELGLYFRGEPPAMEYRTTAASTTFLNIPPGEREYAREASVLLSSTDATLLYELSPHMHYRGWRFEGNDDRAF